MTLCAAAPADGWTSVVVRDTGVGIAAADLPHIFDRVWRADTARGRATAPCLAARAHDGTGESGT